MKPTGIILFVGCQDGGAEWASIAVDGSFYIGLTFEDVAQAFTHYESRFAYIYELEAGVLGYRRRWTHRYLKNNADHTEYILVEDNT